MSKRVLVVDSNSDAAELLEVGLTGFGYVVRTASDARSALAIAAEFNPGIALIDIALPEIDGYELRRRLRESHHALQLVALTAYARPSDRVRAIESGFRAYLIKPVAFVELQRLLASLI